MGAPSLELSEVERKFNLDSKRALAPRTLFVLASRGAKKSRATASCYRLQENKRERDDKLVWKACQLTLLPPSDCRDETVYRFIYFTYTQIQTHALKLLFIRASSQPKKSKV